MADGSVDFSGGIDSGRVTTVQSAANPHGLPRTMLAWLTNGTVRGGGILQRTGWTKLCTVQPGTALYQCGYLYEPSFADPHLILSIGGRILQVRVDTDNSVHDLSSAFGLTNPADIPKAFMTQGEQYLVMQAGDLAINNPPTLPLFWDGTTLRRSRGIAAAVAGSVPSVFTLTTSAAWVVPAVGASVVVTLNAPYPGLIGDKGSWRQPGASVDTGLFLVTAIVGTTVTLKTVSSNYSGGTAFAATATFTTILEAVAEATNELPAATAMVYYQGRIWYAQGRIYTAGDIVGGPSGTLANQFKDSILKVTENPLALGGDGFAVPSTAGDIRALSYSANLDTTLGQGPLYIFTRRQVYQLAVPVTRADWIAATSNNAPLQTIAQKKYGTVSDRCVVAINGDLFYQSLEPAIRSLFVSIRYFQQWGNVPISRNLNRALKFNDRALMTYATGIEFDNRLWQALLPVQTPVGVAFQAIAPLDFDIISSFGQEEAKPPPAWEGILEGLDVLQLFEGDFGGRQRAFAAVHSREDGSIQVWEFTDFLKTDNGDNRVTWFFETPAYTWNKDFALKQLDGGEVWIDKVSGTIEMTFEYRVDADPCWQPWFRTQFCAARSTCEDVNNPVCYPVEQYCEGYRFPITLPSPQPGTCDTLNKRPTNQGYQFQMRVTVKGWCRVRGFILFALPVERQPFQGLNE
jgi:hypothetical protein